MSQAFGRALALTTMPGVRATRANTIVDVNPVIGHSASHVVQTACAVEYEEDENGKQRQVGKQLTAFLQVIADGTIVQIVLPDKVVRTLFNQIKSISAPAKKSLTKEQREQKRLRDARKLVKEANAKRRQRVTVTA